MNSLNFIVLTGRFLAGKDTQGKLLLNKLGDKTEIISTGDIYREAKGNTGEFAKYHHFIAPYIEDIDVRGLLLPDSVITKIVQEVIKERIELGKDTFIFTGFPRTEGQLASFDEMISEFKAQGPTNEYFVEYLVDDEITKERAIKRRKEYEEKGSTPRPEDADEIVIKRIKNYYQTIDPMIQKLKKEGRLTIIDGAKEVEPISVETERIIYNKER